MLNLKSDSRSKRFIIGASLLAGLVILGPSSARDFGDHERPWARDANGEIIACTTEFERVGAEQVALGLEPAPASMFEPGERAIAVAAERQARLDAFEAELVDARNAVRQAAQDLNAERERVEQLRSAVNAEIERLAVLEDEASQRRVDMLRNVRPRTAATLLADEELEEIARLLAAMAPRESAAIVAAFPARRGAEIFEAMKPFTEEDEETDLADADFFQEGAGQGAPTAG